MGRYHGHKDLSGGHSICKRRDSPNEGKIDLLALVCSGGGMALVKITSGPLVDVGWGTPKSSRMLCRASKASGFAELVEPSIVLL